MLNKYDFYYYTKKCLAVRIFKSQTRNVSSIYFLSPLKTWVEMLEKKIKNHKIKKYCKDYISRGYIGILQIKHFSNFQNLIREIFYYFYYRPKNLYNVSYIALIIYCILVPKKMSLLFTDFVKSKILSKFIKI